MAGPIALPEGYVLDNQPGLPQGYVMDSAKGNSSADDYYNHVQAQKASGQGFWGGLGQDLTDKAQALQTGLTQLPLGALQAGEELLARGARAVGAPQTAQGSTNAANAIGQVAAEQLAKSQNAIRNNPTNEAFQIIPQALQLGGAGTSLPAILGAGATAGALSPKMTPQDLQDANYQPANTMFDKSMNALSYLPSQAVDAASAGLGTDPNARLASAVKGALTAGEGYGIAKGVPKVLDAVVGDTNNAGANPAAPADVVALKNAAYAKADNSGQVFAPNDLSNKFAADINQAIPKPGANGQLLEGDNYLNNILQKYTGYEDKPLGISEADKIDKDLTGNITRAYKAGYNYEGKKLSDIQDNFRKQLEQAPAGADLAQARGLAAADFKLRDLQAIKDTANTQGEIKSGLKSLYKRIQKNPSGWTPDEISAIQDGSKTGLLTGALQTLGNKITSGVVGGIGGAVGGGIPGALAGAAIGEGIGFPFRLGAKALQAGKLDNAIDTVMQRPVIQKAAILKDLAENPREIQGPQQPQQIKLLPAPDKTVAVNTEGQAVPTYRTNEQMQAAQELNNLGLTPDVLNVQKANQLNQIYGSRNAALEAQKQAELNQLQKLSAPTLQEMFDRIKSAEIDKANAIGEKPQFNPIMQALEEAFQKRKNSTK